MNRRSFLRRLSGAAVGLVAGGALDWCGAGVPEPVLEFDEYVRLTLRSVAAGLNVSPELLGPDIIGYETILCPGGGGFYVPSDVAPALRAAIGRN